MITKTYEAPNTVISDFCVFVNGKARRISFNVVSVYEGSHTGRGSMFTTSDEAMQRAIEGSRLYGRRIFLFKEVKTEDAPVEMDGDTVAFDVDRLEHIGTDVVSSMNDAREYLERRFGIDRKKISNPKALLRVAQENGVVFDITI